MKYVDESIALEVFCQYADTGERLPEKVIGIQAVMVATPGKDFNVCVTASGLCFGGDETDKIKASCSVGEYPDEASRASVDVFVGVTSNLSTQVARTVARPTIYRPTRLECSVVGGHTRREEHSEWPKSALKRARKTRKVPRA